MKKYLWLMVGPPGTGKSTAAKKIFQKDAMYVSRDEIRFALLEPGDDYFDKEEEVVSTFYKTIADTADEGKVVIADATHLNEKVRKATVNAVRLNGDDELILNAVVACTPINTALERNRQRTGRARVPDTVIRNMYAGCTDPKDDKDLDYTFILYINENQEVIDCYSNIKKEG